MNFKKIFSIINHSENQYNKEVDDVENNARLLSDTELLTIFADNFALRTEFFSQIGSEKYKAYFGAINTAVMEMLNNPQLYYQATKRSPTDLIAMCEKKIPGFTNSILCGLIFCMGRYAVVSSSILCVDFAAIIPNCIAVYLLLTAQHLPATQRSQLIDAGDEANKQPLQSALDALSVCDQDWKYMIL